MKYHLPPPQLSHITLCKTGKEATYTFKMEGCCRPVQVFVSQVPNSRPPHTPSQPLTPHPLNMVCSAPSYKTTPFYFHLSLSFVPHIPLPPLVAVIHIRSHPFTTIFHAPHIRSAPFISDHAPLQPCSAPLAVPMWALKWSSWGTHIHTRATTALCFHLLMGKPM